MSSSKKTIECPYCHLPLRLSPKATNYLCRNCESSFEPKEVLPTDRSAVELETQRAKKLLNEYQQGREKHMGDVSLVEVGELLNVPRWKLVLSFLGVPVEEEEDGHPFPIVLGFFMTVCCLIHFFSPPDFKDHWALDPKNLSHAFGLNFFSYSLIHADFIHLFGNLFFVLPFIDNVEERLGGVKTLAFLILSAVGSAVLHLFFAQSQLLLVGASGVCFAIVLFYSLSFPKMRLLMIPPIFGIFAMRYRLRVYARTFAGFYLFKEILFSFYQIAGYGNVSHLGHVGGALVGILFYLLFSRSEREASES